MTITLMDSFDMYPDVAATSYGLQGAWNISINGDTALVAGRFGGQAVQIDPTNGNAFIGQPTTGNTFAIGFACRLDQALPVSSACCFLRETDANGTNICGVGINGSQQYYLWVGSRSNIVALLADPVTVAAWHYVELVVTIDPAAGSMVMYLDGFEVLSFTGAIANGPAAYFGLGVEVSTNNAERSFDDFYLSTAATRVGEMRIECLYPTTNVQQEWTPLSGGSNVAMVQETLVDGNTTYVFSSTVGNEDLYDVASLTGSPVTIAAVQVRLCADKDNSATRQLASSLQSGSTLVHGATFAVPFDSFIYQRDIYVEDPNTSAAWTGVAVNAIQIGQKVIA